MMVECYLYSTLSSISVVFMPEQDKQNEQDPFKVLFWQTSKLSTIHLGVKYLD